MDASKLTTYLLRFTSPVHFADAMDDYGKSLTTYHSDSLQAALTAALHEVGAAGPSADGGDFVLSSLFPFARASDNSLVYFFPKPLIYNEMPYERLSEHKKLKKIQWLDQSYFEQVINGYSLFEIADKNQIYFQKYLTVKNLEGSISSGWVAARVQVPRFTTEESKQQDARPFYMERLTFDEHAGMYFLALSNNEGYEKIENALNVLKDMGLGTDRNVGNGQFEWSKGEITLNLPDSDCLMGLGIFIPEKEKIDSLQSELIGFRILRRGGWITTPPATTYRKNDIYAFDVGTVIKRSTTNHPQVMGRVVDLTPKADFIREILGHPILRSGKTIFIPIKY